MNEAAKAKDPPEQGFQRYTTKFGTDIDYPAEIAGMSVDLQVPDDFCIVHDIHLAMMEAIRTKQTSQRVYAAALMLCWPMALRRKGTPQYNENIATYSRFVMNFLHGLGADMGDVALAGAAAARMVMDSQLTEDDIARAMGKSSASREPGSGSGSDASGSPTSDREDSDDSRGR